MSNKIIGAVEITFSIEVPEGTEDENEYVVNTIKEKLSSLNGDDLNVKVSSDAEWCLW